MTSTAQLDLPAVSRLAGDVLDEVERAVVGKRDGPRAGAGRHPRRRPRAAGGLPGPGQDAGRAVVRPGARAGLHPRPVHPRPAAGRRHRLVPLRPAHRASSRSGRARSSPGCCSPTRSTARPPKTQAALLEAMQEGQVTVEGADLPAARARSTCSPPPTRSSTRAPTRCPRRSSTGSCCGSASATRRATEEWEVLQRRMARRQEEQDAARRRPTPPGCCAMQARRRGRSASTRASGAYCVALAAATRARTARADGRLAARLAGAAAHARGRTPCIARPRLRAPPRTSRRWRRPVLAHRITVKPELWMSDVTAPPSWRRCSSSVPVPSAREYRVAG